MRQYTVSFTWRWAYDAQNMLRQTFDNKHQISCILLVSLSSTYVRDAQSQESKIPNAITYKEPRASSHLQDDLAN